MKPIWSNKYLINIFVIDVFLWFMHVTLYRLLNLVVDQLQLFSFPGWSRFGNAVAKICNISDIGCCWTRSEMCNMEAVFCTEGERLIDLEVDSTLDKGLLTLHASYYVFNTSYPKEWKDLFIFIDAILLGIKNAASKRISLQKFVSDITWYSTVIIFKLYISRASQYELLHLMSNYFEFVF